nr:hypothetical protein CFP56_01407 [Quercus suber]
MRGGGSASRDGGPGCARSYRTVLKTAGQLVTDMIPVLKLTSPCSRAAYLIVLLHRARDVGLMVLLTRQRASVELLRAGRHVQRRIFVEEVDRLQRHFDDFAGHHGKVLDAWDLLCFDEGRGLSLARRWSRLCEKLPYCSQDSWAAGDRYGKSGLECRTVEVRDVSGLARAAAEQHTSSFSCTVPVMLA